ncbi:MAG: outer membrane beta-barrel protein [Alphaproteobacteria bacterium]|nr:outer membrane beta-barrel protein [Alphaproteobacteria bacterium]
MLSSLALFPKFETEVNRDDNIFRTESGAVADEILVLRPSLALRSDWDNHAVNLTAEVEFGRHDKTTSEDYEDYDLAADTRIDVSEAWTISPRLSHGKAHEQRGGVDDPGASAAQTVYRTSEGKIETQYFADAILLRGSGTWTVLDYDDAGVIDNDDRDRLESAYSLRAGYEFSPGTVIFVQPGLRFVDYDQAVDNFGLRRDSEGYDVQVGLTWDVSGVTFAEFSIGYMERDYDDPALPTASGLSAQAVVIWNATDLLTVTATVGRQIAETTLPGVAGILQTAGSVRVDYEVLENLLINLEAAGQNDDFQGGGREDDSMRLTAGAKYFMGRNWHGQLRYQRETRESNAIGADYTANSIMALLGISL